MYTYTIIFVLVYFLYREHILLHMMIYSLFVAMYEKLKKILCHIADMHEQPQNYEIVLIITSSALPFFNKSHIFLIVKFLKCEPVTVA